ncbi:hypothetical protein KJ840_01530 [Patescibacteria group bacterium]|nr:hypothetical protein [Patescibacteria group bacterium]
MLSNQHKRDIKYSNDFPWEEQDDSIKEEMERKAQSREQKNSAKISGFGEVFYGRDLKWYKEVALWPMFILLIIELGVRVMQTKYFYLWNEQIFDYLVMAARIILFIYLAITAIKNYKATKMQMVFAGAMGGLVTGCVLAVFQLFWYFQLWTFFNLIGGPLLMALIGAVITWLVYILFAKQLTK